ncbi:3571_t:CDS:2 [Dentiscutata erythropus]|uniref:3571_t:CDS:1 n=1 Tax=Dentiscutata erythropus TaxID=1348616 RepID=A0A9N9ESA8_9GLOM|nr:3571_t:CDS:2 [Dentiscutata erythropus]
MERIDEEEKEKITWDNQTAHYIEGESTHGLKFEENYTTNPNLDQSWQENNNNSFPGFPNMDLDLEEWSQSRDEYIDWEYYDSL